MQYGRTKPPLGAQIDWTHPLSAGLVAAVLMNEGGGPNLYDSVDRRSSYWSGAAAPWFIKSQHGLAVQFPNSSSFDSFGVGRRAGIRRFSAAWLMNIATVPGQHSIFGTGAGGIQVRISGQKTNLLKATVADMGSSTATQAINTWYHGGISYDGATVRFYLNGAPDGTASSAQTFTNSVFGVASNGSGGETIGTGSALGHLFVWDRVISAADFATMASAPFCFVSNGSRIYSVAPPTPVTAQVKAKGKGIPPLRVPSSGSTAIGAGSMAVFAVSADFDGTAILYNSAGVSQGSMTQDARANNSGKVQSLIFSKYVADAGDYYVIFTMSSAGVAAGALVEVANVAASSQLDQTAAATGSSTSPSSGATSATAQAYEIAIGAIGTEGPGGDTQGAWSNTFIPIAFIGTTGGAAAANTSLSLGYKILSATGAQTAAKTGITSRQWGAAIATYKGLVTTAPAADPVSILTGGTLEAGTVGTLYLEYIEASGGAPAYTFAVTSGSLPDGVSLATNGALSGTPTTAGAYSFTITATDSLAESSPKAFSLTIAAAPVIRRGFRPYAVTLPGRLY